MSRSADVSVIVPAHDAAPTIVESIRSILRGSIRPREIVVVDDRSSDRGCERACALDPGVRVVPSDGAGAGPARNTGARSAFGEWLAFLDADDLWEPHRLERGLQAAAGAAFDAAIHGRIRQFFDPSLGRADAPSPECSDACHPDTLLIRREVLLREGGFRDSSEVSEVVRWYADRRHAGRPFHFIPEVLAARRIHGRNTGILRADRRGDYVRAVKSLLDGRRNRDGAARAPEPAP